MNHFYQNIGPENWFNYEDLYSEMVSFFPSNSLFVEVGSWKGRSTAYMAVEILNSNKDIKFHSVDTWEGSPEHADDDLIKNNKLFETFLSNISPVKEKIHVVKMKSVDAAALYNDKSIDFVFIDACHEYDCVKEDINAWLPKVKQGGIIAGHDYSWSGVRQAVHETINNPSHKSRDCWLTRVN